MTTTIRNWRFLGILLLLSCAAAAGLLAMAGSDAPTMGAGGPAVTSSHTSTRGAAGGSCPNCDDGNPCTEDTCDTEYQCQYAPITCSDGLQCTTDTCSPAIGCVFTPMDCWAGSVCVTYGCNEATVTCELVSKKICNDHNACTVDSCDPEIGCFYAPLWCNDQDTCTTDFCDPAVGCVHRANGCGWGGIDSGGGSGGSGVEAPTLTASAGEAPGGERVKALTGARAGSATDAKGGAHEIDPIGGAAARAGRLSDSPACRCRRR